MPETFQGRVLLAGNVTGEALVSHAGVNTLSSYKNAVRNPKKGGICADQDNPDLYGKDLAGKILCLPQTIGSTSGGMALQAAATLDLTPKAMLFSEHVDSLAAAGLIMADVWSGKRIVAIDQLGKQFLETVKEGQKVEIKDDGTVILY
jgi:predicted aconitase with swiveling domain